MALRRIFPLFCALFLAANAYGASKIKEVEIPRSVYKDIYKYYVVEESKKNTNFILTYKRLSYDTMLYGKVEINCPSKVIRSLGTSIKSVKAINSDTPTQWAQARIGSIESDMITYVCR